MNSGGSGAHASPTALPRYIVPMLSLLALCIVPGSALLYFSNEPMRQGQELARRYTHVSPSSFVAIDCGFSLAVLLVFTIAGIRDSKRGFGRVSTVAIKLTDPQKGWTAFVIFYVAFMVALIGFLIFSTMYFLIASGSVEAFGVLKRVSVEGPIGYVHALFGSVQAVLLVSAFTKRNNLKAMLYVTVGLAILTMASTIADRGIDYVDLVYTLVALLFAVYKRLHGPQGTSA